MDFTTSPDIELNNTNIVIIGLPGSGKLNAGRGCAPLGKSHLMKTFSNHIHFDDFINTLYDGALMRYNQFVSQIHDSVIIAYLLTSVKDILSLPAFRPYFNPKTTKIILFANDLGACVRNVKVLDKTQSRVGIEKIIQYLSSIYDFN